MSIDWPLASNVIRRPAISNTFGWVRKHKDGSPKPHQGWDFHASIGTDACAVADGTVVFTVNNQGDYGAQIRTKFAHAGATLYAFYAHLQSAYGHHGQAVTKGPRIARTGETGNAFGMVKADRHLHFEIRTHAYLGTGLAGRKSPISVYGICPLNGPRREQSA